MIVRAQKLALDISLHQSISSIYFSQLDQNIQDIRIRIAPIWFSSFSFSNLLFFRDHAKPSSSPPNFCVCVLPKGDSLLPWVIFRNFDLPPLFPTTGKVTTYNRLQTLHVRGTFFLFSPVLSCWYDSVLQQYFDLKEILISLKRRANKKLVVPSKSLIKIKSDLL